jgi:hypothetical protein
VGSSHGSSGSSSGSDTGSGSSGGATRPTADAGGAITELDAGDDGSSPGNGTDAAAGGDGASGSAGKVQPSEVVMLGDSYMDPSFGNVGPTLMTIANKTWRPYYLGGASINGGDGQFNIPYQFYNMAVTDNPDIKVIVMDGGGNDLLLNNRQCLTTPVMGDTACHMVISDVVAKAQMLLNDMPNHGVQDILYLFYPHIDTTTIYTGPDSNDWLDYAYPLAAQACCGSGAQPAGAADLTCHGTPVAGVNCTFIDTRPEFVGHNDSTMMSEYWLDGFGIHPNKQGAQVIANKMWTQMQKYCIAQ